MPSRPDRSRLRFAPPTPALTKTCEKCGVEKAESRPAGAAPRPRVTLRTQIESLVAIKADNCGLTGSHVLPAPGKATPGGRGRLKPPSRCQGASIPAVPCPLTSPPSRSLPPLGRQNMISGSETSASSSFPLSGPVAFAGSRHGSPFPVAPVVRAVLSSGGSVRVGCAAGVDAVVRSCCPSATVVRASSFSGPPRVPLAARTSAVVSGASALCVFPPAGGSLGPGSSLAVREALRRDLPVWCAGPQPSIPAPWLHLRLAGVPGFVCFPAPSLF